MKRWRHYFAVYREFVNTCFSEAMSYRTHFVLLILMDLVFYASTFLSVDFIFNHVEAIGPWKREQFLFFIAFMLTIDQLHMTFISESFWSFSFDLRKGNLDFLLLKPIGTLFCVFFRYIRPSTVVNTFVTWGALVYFASQCHISTLAWIGLPFAVLLGLALLVSLEILLSMSMFWVVEGWGINFLRMQFQQLSRWPDFIYKFFARKFFTIAFPILLVGSAPVRWLLDVSSWTALASLIISMLISWLLIAYFWKKGLRQYESASS